MSDIFKKYKIGVLISIASAYIVVVFMIAMLGYRDNYQKFILLSADSANSVFDVISEIIPDDYHDKIYGNEEKIKDVYIEISKKLTSLADRKHISKAFTVVEGIDDVIYLTTSNYSGNDEFNDEKAFSLYFKAEDITKPFYKQMKKLFSNSTITSFSETDDIGGEIIYSSCVKKLSKAKNHYLVCLSMPMTELGSVVKEVITRKFIEFLLLVGIFLVFVFAVLKSLLYREELLKIEFECRSKDLSEALEKAEKANKIKADFLASVSHSIRTPMNAILGFSEAIKSEIFGPIANEKYKEYIDYIYESSNIVLDLVNDILEVAKVEANKSVVNEEYIDVADILSIARRIIKGYKGSEKRNIDIMKLSRGFPELKIDRKMFLQVLLNLLANAIKYTRDNGYIFLKAYVNEKNGKMVFSVKDDGCGISKSISEKIISSFLENDDKDLMLKHHVGTGIGLSLVRNYVKMFDGEVTFTSTVNMGSEFIVSFPAERVRVRI